MFWLPGLILVSLISASVLAVDVERWDFYELSLPGPADGNPFGDVDVFATFTSGQASIKVRGFYDGDGTYRIRFMPPELGVWKYQTQSNHAALAGKTGEFTCITPSPSNHGPVRVANRYHFAYQDGTRFIPIGTTSYNWAHQKGDLPQRTLDTLKSSPFTKIRMCALPQRVNEKEPALLPFELLADGKMDTSRFNARYFQNLEQRVGQLRDLGIEAEIIVLHPYDRARTPFAHMDAATDDRYVRYLIARLAPYRNIWWSMGNEFELLRDKTLDDWDRLFNIFYKEDPVGHPRSIHHVARPYDVTKPWVTHMSATSPEAVADLGRAQIFRQMAQKPVVFDEIRYEGNISARWGNLTAEDMVRRFWVATVSGVYAMHGESLVEAEGAPAWLGQGGVLIGKSPARIAFLRKILEAGPAEGIDPIDQFMRSDLSGKIGQYYLIYFNDKTPTEWEFSLHRAGLQEDALFHADIIDTWNMTITPIEKDFALERRDGYTFRARDNPTIPLPGKPYIALRLTRLPNPTTVPSTK